MKLLHITNLLYNRPLFITRDGFNTVNMVVQNKLNNIATPLDEINEEEDNPYIMNIDKEEGIAHLYIQGPIGKKLSFLEKMCGATDIDLLRDEIDFAVTYPEVNTLLFHVDSPGGSVDGVPELAEYIADISKDKQTVALVDGLACSAAYYLISGCNSIIALGKTSYIGSVGVYAYLLDESRKYENAGVTPVLIKSGVKKGEGLPGMPITEEMKAGIQSEVDYLYKNFADFVSKYRPDIDKEKSMNGGSWYAEEALTRGFIDSIISNMKELIV